MLLPRGFGLLLAILVSSCSSVRYYSHLTQGQWSLWSQREAISSLLQRDHIDPQLRTRLENVLAIRQFASDYLGLVDNNSYRYYTDLQRPYVVWNVFAAPELSIHPAQWCFPFAGCVSYRGYFSETLAQAFAEQLAQQGMDTYVAGVTAYSTLGWFDDPVLNTFLYTKDTHLMGIIFHELAHQQLYLSGDTAFNESFARCVEIAGVKHWLRIQQQNALIDHYLQQQRMHSDFVDTVLGLRRQLAELYQQHLSNPEKRRGKQQIINDFLNKTYSDFKARWNGYMGFDRWVKADQPDKNEDNTPYQLLNNAKLNSVASYHQWLPAFEQLLRDSRGDFHVFYQQARYLSELNEDERRHALDALDKRAREYTLLN